MRKRKQKSSFWHLITSVARQRSPLTRERLIDWRKQNTKVLYHITFHIIRGSTMYSLVNTDTTVSASSPISQMIVWNFILFCFTLKTFWTNQAEQEGGRSQRRHWRNGFHPPEVLLTKRTYKCATQKFPLWKDLLLSAESFEFWLLVFAEFSIWHKNSHLFPKNITYLSDFFIWIVDLNLKGKRWFLTLNWILHYKYEIAECFCLAILGGKKILRLKFWESCQKSMTF